MTYQVVYSKKAIKGLKKIDKQAANIIVAWIEKNLIDTDNPRKTGKDLKGNLAKYWRYRVGDYRIIAEIEDERLVITCVEIAHRKQVYKRYGK